MTWGCPIPLMMVSTPFHVKCRYTNKLICFCAHGNQRLGSGKGEDRGGALRKRRAISSTMRPCAFDTLGDIDTR